MKFLFALLALYLIPGSAIACWLGLGMISGNQALWLPLIIGLGAGFLLYYLIIRRIHLLQNFEHELTHALVALLFFRRIRSFKISGKQGGLVRYSSGFGGKFGDLMITIAPYFLPTYTLIAIFVRPLINANTLFYFDLFLGFTIAYHLVTTIDEVKRNWSKETFTSMDGESTRSDIGRMGYITAFLSIIGFTLLFFGLIFWMASIGYQGMVPFCKVVIVKSYLIFKPLALECFILLKSLFLKLFG